MLANWMGRYLILFFTPLLLNVNLQEIKFRGKIKFRLKCQLWTNYNLTYSVYLPQLYLEPHFGNFCTIFHIYDSLLSVNGQQNKTEFVRFSLSNQLLVSLHEKCSFKMQTAQNYHCWHCWQNCTADTLS